MPRCLNRELSKEERLVLVEFVREREGKTAKMVVAAWNALHAERTNPPLVTVSMVLYHQKKLKLEVSRSIKASLKSCANSKRKKALEKHADERAAESVEKFRELARTQLEANPDQIPVPCQYCNLPYPKTDTFFQKYTKNGVERLDTAHCIECRKERKRTGRRKKLAGERPEKSKLREEKRKRSDRRLMQKWQQKAGADPVSCDHADGACDCLPLVTRKCLTCPGTFPLHKDYFAPTKTGFAYRCKLCKAKDRRKRKRERADLLEGKRAWHRSRHESVGLTLSAEKYRAKIQVQRKVAAVKHNEWKERKLREAEELLSEFPGTPTLICKKCHRELPRLEEWYRFNKKGYLDRRTCVICIVEQPSKGPLAKFVTKNGKPGKGTSDSAA